MAEKKEADDKIARCPSDYMQLKHEDFHNTVSPCIDAGGMRTTVALAAQELARKYSNLAKGESNPAGMAALMRASDEAALIAKGGENPISGVTSLSVVHPEHTKIVTITETIKIIENGEVATSNKTTEIIEVTKDGKTTTMTSIIETTESEKNNEALRP